MHISDLKQILWWLSGGLLICAGVLVVIIVLKPSKSFASEYSIWGEEQVGNALRIDLKQKTASGDFNRYRATYELKIDGIAPPVVEPEPDLSEPKDLKPPPLAKFIEVVGIWTNVVFYRLINGGEKQYDVVVGKEIDNVREIRPPAKLIRIEHDESPFCAVFLVRGEEEIFVVPHEVVLLSRKAPDLAPAGTEVYRGPDGGVKPQEGRKPPVLGLKIKGDTITVGSDIQELIRSGYDSILKGVRWSSTSQGVAISKISKGSALDQWNPKGNPILQEKDVIVSINNVKVQSKQQIINHFRKNTVEPGTPIVVKILRYGKMISQTYYAPKR